MLSQTSDVVKEIIKLNISDFILLKTKSSRHWLLFSVLFHFGLTWMR